MNTDHSTGEKLVCESCGKDLSCGAKTGSCWCFEIEVDPNALDDLRGKFKNCLCRNCLTNTPESSSPNSTAPSCAEIKF